MQLFSRQKPLVGLDIGSSSVKAVELRRVKKGFELIHAGLEPLASDTVVDGAIMDALSVSDSIGKVFTGQKIKTKTVATSVSGHSVIVKKIPLPVMSEEELEESIQWEAEQHIPFDISDVNLDYQVLNTESAASSDVLLVAVKKDKILNHTNVITQAGKVPVVVDIDAFAIQNAFETNYNPAPNATIALLNIGASIMNIVVTRGGMPLFTRDVSVGGNQFTDALQKDMNLSFEEAEQVKQGKSIEGCTERECCRRLFNQFQKCSCWRFRRLSISSEQQLSANNCSVSMSAAVAPRLKDFWTCCKADWDCPLRCWIPSRILPWPRASIWRIWMTFLLAWLWPLGWH